MLNIYINNHQSKLHFSKNQSVVIHKIGIYKEVGQQIAIITKDLNKDLIEIPFQVQTGVYLIKVTTNNGIISKKLLKE